MFIAANVYCIPVCCCSKVCKKQFQFPRESRAVLHVFSASHHKAQKEVNDANITKGQQRQMQSSSAATVKGEEVVRRIQNYVAQNVAARSLPFTAGEMALDCVSASLCTIVGAKPLSDEAVRLLTKAGLVHDAAALHRLKFVAASRNSEGGPRASPDAKTASPPRKRVRVQLRRNAVQKRRTLKKSHWGRRWPNTTLDHVVVCRLTY